MYGPPAVLYVGADAAAVERAWAATDEDLDVVTLDPTDTDGGPDPPAAVVDALDDGRVDAVVCRADGEFDAVAALERVRGRSASLPVVVLASDDAAFGPGDAADLGVSSYLQTAADADAAAHLTDLVSLIERERTVHRERTMLSSLLEQVPLSIYFKDRDGRHLRVSDAMPTLTEPGYIESPDGTRHHAPDDVVGKTDFDLYPAELAEATVADDEHVLETGESIDDRVEHAYGDALEGTYVTTSKAPWYDDSGEVVGLVGVTRNISERKQYEKQLERQNERLERFASVISHDLRNPLEVAIARAEFAREDPENADEHLEILDSSLDRIDALIEDVLTLAREGETVSDPERVALAGAATDAWAVVDTADASLAVETERTLSADPSRLQQLLENVFRNSAEHGGDDVTVTVGDLDEQPGFFLADDGSGIPESERDRVFEPGYSTGDGGTGLGLSIVRTIAEAHGWEATATESADGGARFEFETFGAIED